MKTIKELLKGIKEIKKEGKFKTVIAYNKKWQMRLYSIHTLIPSEYFICELQFHENDGFYKVNSRKELDNLIEALKNLDDVQKLTYDINRLDAYYKNGRKAMTILRK